MSEMESSTRFVILARDPFSRESKTRLTAEVGRRNSRNVYLRCLADTVSAVAGYTKNFHVSVAGTSDVVSVLLTDLGIDCSVQYQNPGEFAYRQYSILRDAKSSGASRVAIVASDNVGLGSDDLGWLDKALDSSDVAIIPSADGGYAVLATTGSPEPLLAVNMSTTDTLSEVVAAFDSAGMTTKVSDKCVNDIDTAEDLSAALEAFPKFSSPPWRRLQSVSWNFAAVAIEERVEQVSDLVKSGQINSLNGAGIRDLEKLSANVLGSDTLPIATSSATSALELISEVMDIPYGSEVVVPAFGWASVAGVFARIGCHIRIADVDESLCVTSDSVRNALRDDTRAVVVTHMRGKACNDVADLSSMLSDLGVLLIEDCAQAWGSRLNGKHVGTFGDASFYSFQANKNVSAGEGGLALFKSDRFAESGRMIAGYHGSGIAGVLPRNIRMSELTAALAIPGLKSLEVSKQVMVERVAAAKRILDLFNFVKVSNPSIENGLTIPLWLKDEEMAGQIQSSLAAHGLEAYRPGVGQDLHGIRGWSSPQIVSSRLNGFDQLKRYVDLPIPVAPGVGTDFLEKLNFAMEDVE